MVMMTWLADVLRGAGLAVEEADGWKTRGRGPMTTVRGILCHHTAGPMKGDRPSLGTVRDGRPDLEGPLSQLFLTRGGVFIVLAAGRCNHAGVGIWQGVTTGNSSFIGIEAENAGTPQDPWPDIQMDAYIRGCAAILKDLGLDDVMVAGHREYAVPRGRKIDPLFDMLNFRTQVSEVMAGNKPAVSQIQIWPVAPSRLMLRKGDQGPAVRELQVALNRWLMRNGGDAMAKQLNLDAAFGPATLKLVLLVQKTLGLTQDGFVGPATWKALGV